MDALSGETRGAPTLAEVSQAYDARFAQGDLQESQTFYRWVLRCLGPQPGASLLDVSCGAGRLLSEAKARCQVHGSGIDISSVALRFARRQAPASSLTRSDGVELPFREAAFDCITNLGSLEHYTDIPRGVQEMVRVLKPGGRAAILLPNSYYLGDILWLVWRTGRGPSHQQRLERFATLVEWRELLEAGGFRLERAYPYNFRFPRTRADWRWYRRYPRKLLNLLLAPAVPFNLAYCFLFIVRKPA